MAAASAWIVALALVAALCCSPAIADEHDHKYDHGEELVLWMNTVGPYHNRQETYSFFTLPFCKGPKKAISHHHETIGENLQGVSLQFSGLDMKFGINVPTTEFCSVELTEKKYKAFRYAIKNHYWYQMYLDDLPMWALVGDFGAGHNDKERSTDTMFIWTHKKFDVGVNGNRIVDVNVTTGKRVPLKPGITLHFTYEVNFKQSKVSFDKRFDKYLDPHFFQHRIHWFSIFNSFMMVIFLVGLVTMILMRTLRKDFVRYSKDNELDDIERDLGDEYGWKQVHGDVFRPPDNVMLFSALVGTGYQIAFVALCVILFVIMGDLYTERGSVLTTAIFVYAATSPVNGYFGGGLYARLKGTQWIKQTLLSALLMPAVVSTAILLVNFVAIYYNASRAIPFTTMLVVVCIWLFVVLPLTLVGAVLGRNLAGTMDIPCRINPVPRPIPEKKWFMHRWVISLLGGLLPFGSIFIEIYFVFTSFWAYKVYYVYGFMLLVFLILTIVTVCVTVVCTYFLLNSEDYRWHWTAFLSGASVALYVYMYSFYYYVMKTKMSGAFQTTFYFGYSALFALVVGLMCGTFGYAGSSVFVYRIYKNLKLD
ncbi:endomembrane protein emp70 [Salpingoeca rosetta]|uniref:Transmembrane 9 superfamily member n=1 Tax=Salpingoeca rosetta (strain ATCC 50818 / BSB-021) TaxID=946362 RepID=F2UKB3_SALR5|nr:endomembrane protein emp70 [Salpingoeca rosetta]EGD77562.1 endomembrane protein emp70 [Salpingoeca rosetta]|eukprot:XP_004990450.1 endomembrane protein emp70 [Salpingoeca rosetta]